MPGLTNTFVPVNLSTMGPGESLSAKLWGPQPVRVPYRGPGYLGLARQLFRRGMAELSGYFGSRGMLSSSYMQQRAAQLWSDAQLRAWQMYQQKRQVDLGWAQFEERRRARYQAWRALMGRLSMESALALQRNIAAAMPQFWVPQQPWQMPQPEIGEPEAEPETEPEQEWLPGNWVPGTYVEYPYPR